MTLEEKKEYLRRKNYPVDEMSTSTINHLYYYSKKYNTTYQTADIIDASPDPKGLKEFIEKF